MLEGKRVKLRALEPSDAKELAAWHADREFSILDGVTYPTSTANWEEFIRAASSAASTARYMGIEIEPAELIGYIGLKRVRKEDGTAELGIAIKRERWGQGYGRDATVALLQFAFEEMNLHRVTFTVADYNSRARRMYESCGFREEGRLRESKFHDGRYHDNVLMGMLAREFLQTAHKEE